MVPTASHVPGVSALSVEKTKRLHYDPLAAAHVPPAVFIPLALELDGRFGDEANDFFKRLSIRVGESLGERNAWLSYWRRRLSVLIRRAVSVAVDARYVKAMAAAASSRQGNTPFNLYRNDTFAHILAVVPLGNADPTFESAARFPPDSL
jgi:hypothetical protein